MERSRCIAPMDTPVLQWRIIRYDFLYTQEVFYRIKIKICVNNISG